MEEKVQNITLPYDIADKGTEQCQQLAREIMSNTYSCMICFERINAEAKIWSCSQCYKIFHLDCAKDWSDSLKKTDPNADFRCPACQHTAKDVKLEDRCFCGKNLFPDLNKFLPHSCGDFCARPRPNGCPHRCPIQCHPGPCPPCPFKGPDRKCPCGKMTYQIPCGTTEALPQTCGDMCGRPLNCGKHFCTDDCHNGPCAPCSEKETQTCFCGKHTEDRICGTGVEGPNGKSFFCGQTCGKTLDCGNHTCQKLCHSGPCDPCDRKTGFPQRCACGKEMLQRFKRRKTCLDELPSCGKPCGKLLDCGEHRCPEICHDGPCQPCSVKVKVKCACKRSKRTMTCGEVNRARANSMFGEVFRCANKCGKRMSCGNHKCQEICCRGRTLDDYEGHLCTLLCTKKLDCGVHDCDSLCHPGKCSPCTVTLHHGYTCYCGEFHLPGPIRCGEARRIGGCTNPCKRVRPCGHPCPRVCHSDECFPCTVLMTKWCAGGHRKMNCIACHLQPRCDQQCGKLRRCGIHKCKRVCHAGPCEEDGIDISMESCGQECGLKMECGHNCKRMCHPEEECQPKTCQRKVYIQCSCGRRQKKTKCFRKQKIGFLVCDEACQVAVRNQRFRTALGIENKAKLSEFRINTKVLERLERIRDPDQFIRNLESYLTAFVNSERMPRCKGLDKIGDNKVEISQTMNKDKAAVVKELAPKYGLKIETTGTMNYKFTALIKTAVSRVPPVLLSKAVQDFRDNPQRAKAIEAYPPEQILVITVSSKAVEVEDVLLLLHGLAVRVDIFESSDHFLLLFFEDQSMCDASFPQIRKKFTCRKGMEGDSEILSLDIRRVYSTAEEERRKKLDAHKKAHPRSESASFKAPETSKREEPVLKSENPFDMLDKEEETDV